MLSKNAEKVVDTLARATMVALAGKLTPEQRADDALLDRLCADMRARLKAHLIRPEGAGPREGDPPGPQDLLHLERSLGTQWVVMHVAQDCADYALAQEKARAK